MKSVCRHRKAGVCNTSTTAATGLISSICVHVGQYRHADLFLDVGQDLQPLFHAQAAKRVAGRAVGLVERRLVDEWNAERRRDFLQHAGGIERHLLRLDHARAGDQEKWLFQPDFESAQLHAAFLSLAACLCASAALMKAMNSGWPSRGVDLNSGWYCTPTYHGWHVRLRGNSMISRQIFGRRARRYHHAGGFDCGPDSGY